MAWFTFSYPNFLLSFKTCVWHLQRTTMHCARQASLKAYLCIVVMFWANLGAVLVSCHPLCQPEGGQDSLAEFKCMASVCVSAKGS